MREKFNHLYLDSHERKLLIHSLVELKNNIQIYNWEILIKTHSYHKFLPSKDVEVCL